MKNSIFLFLFLPLFTVGQNYVYEITPTDTNFRVLVTDNSREAYPRDVVDYGLLDTASLRLFAYNAVEEMRSREAALQGQIFLARLRAQQASAAINAVIPLDYPGYAADRYATAYEGQYLYAVRGAVNPIAVYVTGLELRRTSNNNLLATLTPVSANWFAATSGLNTVQLYQVGAIWVGTNAQNQIVTLRRQ